MVQLCPPGVAVLVLSQHLSTTLALAVVRQSDGGVGYLLKQRVSRVGQIGDALRRVVAGETSSTPTSSAAWSSDRAPAIPSAS